jgi:hypothetical protein
VTLDQYVTAGAAIAAAGVSWWNHRKIQEVHVLVNQQLTDVMDKLTTRTAERDTLQKEADDHSSKD